MGDTFIGEDGKPRCSWSQATSEYIDYHDHEWGFPVADDQRLFEKLCLESFQSGLSWRTILTKRENFRRAFKQFDFTKVARFGPKDVARLLQDGGIVRHRGKIEAVINNAQQVETLIDQQGSLAAYVWRYEADPPKVKGPVRSTSPESTAMSKDLKKRGWKFVGPTTMYAFMQAMGLVNDHAETCYIYDKVEKSRQKFKRPKS